MKTKIALLIGIFTTIGLSPFANAATVPTLFGTGIDSSGNLLAPGSVDPHYLVIESANNAVVLTNLPATYIPNDEDSQWIWQQSNGQPTNVTRTFRTTFDLTGFDSNTVVVDGRWGTDNQGIDILINGISTGINLPGISISNFGQLHAFQIVDNFVAGTNTLDFIVLDNGAVSAFRTELIVTVVPIPGAVWLFLSAIALGGALNWKSNKA